MDLAIVLILTSNIGSLKLQARVLLKVWLIQGTFPFSKLALILDLHRSNEVTLCTSLHSDLIGVKIYFYLFIVIKL